MRLDFQHRGNSPLYDFVLRVLIGEPMEDKSLIDLCSRESPFIKNYPLKKKVYIDATNDFDPPGPEFHCTDLFGDHMALQARYDVSTCLDGIEHLHKPKGLELCELMQRLAEKQILFTPLGPVWVTENSDDPKTHKCGWYPEELPGYASIVFPNYHGDFGAFFFWRAPLLRLDFERVKLALGDLGQFA